MELVHLTNQWYFFSHLHYFFILHELFGVYSVVTLTTGLQNRTVSLM